MPRSMTEFVKQGGRYASRLKSNHVVHNLDSRVSTTYTRSMVYKKQLIRNICRIEKKLRNKSYSARKK